MSKLPLEVGNPICSMVNRTANVVVKTEESDFADKKRKENLLETPRKSRISKSRSFYQYPSFLWVLFLFNLTFLRFLFSYFCFQFLRKIWHNLEISCKFWRFCWSRVQESPFILTVSSNFESPFVFSFWVFSENQLGFANN